jgi:hypothetical protein
MAALHLIRDVLDDQLVDRSQRKIGKVDGLIIVVRQGKPPRLAYIEVGASTLGHRVHTRLGKLVEKLGHKWGLRRGEPFRIPWSKVLKTGIDVQVDLEADETPIMKWEKWLNEKIVKRIPGSGG